MAMDEAELLASVERTHGVVMPAVIEQVGLTPRQQRHRIERGIWRRMECGALVLVGVPETFWTRAFAIASVMPDAVIAGRSTARVHGIDCPGGDQIIDVITPPGGRTRCPGARIKKTVLTPADITRRSGLVVTTLERTLFDLAAILGPAALRSIIEGQLVERRTTFDRLYATFERLAGQGRPGTRNMRAALAALDSKPPTESELERRFSVLVDGLGLIQPNRQVTMPWMANERGRVDFVFVDERVIVELDGRRFHARDEAFDRDRRRDQEASMHGFETLRFTWRQVVDEPQRVAQVLRTVLRQRTATRTHQYTNW